MLSRNESCSQCDKTILDVEIPLHRRRGNDKRVRLLADDFNRTSAQKTVRTENVPLVGWKLRGECTESDRDRVLERRSSRRRRVQRRVRQAVAKAVEIGEF